MINAPDTFPIRITSSPALLLQRSCLKRMFGFITTAQSVSLMQDNSCLLRRPSIASLLPPKFPSEPPYNALFRFFSCTQSQLRCSVLEWNVHAELCSALVQRSNLCIAPPRMTLGSDRRQCGNGVAAYDCTFSYERHKKQHFRRIMHRLPSQTHPPFCPFTRRQFLSQTRSPCYFLLPAPLRPSCHWP
jgi:hypothetical protein